MHRKSLPQKLCIGLLGHNHPIHHRLMAGGTVMVVGVTIAHTVAMVVPQVHTVVFIGDLVGYLIHGIGAIPFIEWFMEEEEEDDLS